LRGRRVDGSAERGGVVSIRDVDADAELHGISLWPIKSMRPFSSTLVVNELKSNAQTYINQVKQFLLENQTTYTLYIGSDTNRSTGFRILKG
jgi:HPt (histidine-containing phosphotransfer) domain-containing protein